MKKHRSNEKSVLLRRVLSFILAVSLVISVVSINVLADSSSEEMIYEETRDQINFDKLLVYVVNNSRVVVEVNPTLSLLKKYAAKKEKAKYDKYVETHPQEIDDLFDDVNSNNYLCAISYTDAPLELVDDHYERVLKDKNDSSNSLINTLSESNISSPSKRYRFTLKTKIYRLGVGGNYSYFAKTYGDWETSTSILSGEKKPAAGEDYILQACPTVTIDSHLSTSYNYTVNGSTAGKEGDTFFLEDGGDSWTRYSVKDDPVGKAQLKSFVCSQSFKAQSTSQTKKINSYYVHTWKKMSLSVTASGTAGLSGGKPSASITLSLTPSIAEKQWNVYNFVSFNW